MQGEDVKSIYGKKVILRSHLNEDAKFFAFWHNQPDTMFKCGFRDTTTLEQELSRIERRAKAEDAHWYTITDIDGNIIGETGLLRMCPEWHRTDLSIIIPNPQDQGRGYGREAISLMFELAFKQYAMNRIAIGVVAKNTYALDFYKRVGFRQEGIEEQGYYYDGEYSNFIMMRILHEEWLTNLGRNGVCQETPLKAL